MVNKADDNKKLENILKDKTKLKMLTGNPTDQRKKHITKIIIANNTEIGPLKQIKILKITNPDAYMVK